MNPLLYCFLFFLFLFCFFVVFFFFLFNTVFDNESKDKGSIPGQFFPNTQKIILDVFLLNTHYCKVWIKGNWCNQGKRVAPFLTLRCFGYQKGSVRVALDYGWLNYCSILHCCFADLM